MAEALFGLASRTVEEHAKSKDLDAGKKTHPRDARGEAGVVKGNGRDVEDGRVERNKGEGRADEGKVATTSQPTVGETAKHVEAPSHVAPGANLNLGWPFMGGKDLSNAVPSVQNAGGMAQLKKSATRHVYIAHLIAFQQQLQRQAALLYSAPFMNASMSGRTADGSNRTNDENERAGAMATTTKSEGNGMGDTKERYAGPSHPGWTGSGGPMLAGTAFPVGPDIMGMAKVMGCGTGTSAGTGGHTTTQHAAPNYANSHTMASMASQSAQVQFAQQLQSQLGMLQQLGFPFGGVQMPGAYGTGPAQMFGTQNAPGHGMPPYFYGRDGMPPQASGMSGGYMQTTPEMTSMSMGMQGRPGGVGGMDASAFSGSLAGQNAGLSLGAATNSTAAPKLSLNLGTGASHESASHSPAVHRELPAHGMGTGSHPHRLPGR